MVYILSINKIIYKWPYYKWPFKIYKCPTWIEKKRRPAKFMTRSWGFIKELGK